MLKKLLKHEFIATGRLMWVVYAAMALLSVAANVAIRVMTLHSVSHLLLVRLLLILIIVSWVLSLVLGLVGTLVLMIRRFHNNLLTDQGYLMFTLPVSTHALVLSKLIVSAVWMLLSILMVGLCLLIAFLSGGLIHELGEMLQVSFLCVTKTYALNGAVLVLELLLLTYVGAAASMLQFYSAMSLGYGFTNHKALWSVVMYFVQSFVIQLLSLVLMSTPLERSLLIPTLPSSQIIHLFLLSTLALELVLCGVFYLLTVVNLKKRLNLA